MKKLIAICLSLILLATCAPTAFAMGDTSAGSGEVQLSAHRYSSYTITMPATIDLDMGNQGIVTITDANIESGYKVDVFVTNLNLEGAVSLVHTNGMATMDVWFRNIEENKGATAEVPLVSFRDTEVENYGTLTKYFEMDAMYYGTAGYYCGTMTYSFSCNPYEQE